MRPATTAPMRTPLQDTVDSTQYHNYTPTSTRQAQDPPVWEYDSDHSLDSDPQPSLVTTDPHHENDRSRGQPDLEVGADAMKTMPKNRHGLHCTDKQLHTQFGNRQGRYNTLPHDGDTQTVNTFRQQVQRKGLHRTPEERDAKMQAKLGRTAMPVSRYSSDAHAIPVRIPLTPQGWVHDSDVSTSDSQVWVNHASLSFDSQPQESSLVEGTTQHQNSILDQLSMADEESTIDLESDSREPSSTAVSQPLPSPGSTESAEVSAQPHIISNRALVEAREVVNESSSQLLQQAQPVNANQLAETLEHKAARKQKERQCQQIGYCIIFISLVFLAILLAIRFSNTKDDSTDAPTMLPSISPTVLPSSAPSEQLDLLYNDLPNYTQESLKNSSTSQWEAWNWLSNHQNISWLPEWRRKQLFALATFYYAFQGEHWPEKVKSDWMTDTKDECLWFSNRYGSFDSDGMYDELLSPVPEPCNNREFQSLVLTDLQLSNLTPSIPPELALLTSLKHLGLPRNNIRAQLSEVMPYTPGNWGWMNNLIEFYIWGNSISGPLPSELGMMTKLTFLVLNNNYLFGSVPSDLGRMENLTSLYLNSNVFSGLLPSELGMMTKMNTLQLSYNYFSGPVPSELGRMTKMNTLDLGSNLFVGQLPINLLMMANLAVFSVNQNLLTGSIPSEISRITNMNVLSLWDNSFSGLLPSEVGTLTNLAYLYLGNNDMFGSVPSELGRLENLLILHLHGNSFSGLLPNELGMMTSMMTLILANNEFSGTVPSTFGKMTNLTVLDLTGNSFHGVLPSELGMMTSLTEMSVRQNLLSGSIPSDLGRMTQLTAFDLSSNSFTGLVPSELWIMTSLAFLSLHGNSFWEQFHP